VIQLAVAQWCTVLFGLGTKERGLSAFPFWASLGGLTQRKLLPSCGFAASWLFGSRRQALILLASHRVCLARPSVRAKR
jgi:hypothetical protein